jgi:hypothetical protein
VGLCGTIRASGRRGWTLVRQGIEHAQELADLDVVNIGAAGTFVIRQPVTQARLRAELASRLPFDTEIIICRGHSRADVSLF